MVDIQPADVGHFWTWFERQSQGAQALMTVVAFTVLSFVAAFICWRSFFRSRLRAKDSDLQKLERSKNGVIEQKDAIIERLNNDLNSRATRVIAKEDVKSKPIMTLEFSPPREGFVLPITVGGAGRCYIRVLPIVKATVRHCKGFLESVERLDGSSWTPIVLASRPQLYWSEVWEQGTTEVDLYINNNQFLDIGLIREGENVFMLATNAIRIDVAAMFRQYLQSIFRFSIRVVGEGANGSEDAILKLIFQRTNDFQRPSVFAV